MGMVYIYMCKNDQSFKNGLCLRLVKTTELFRVIGQNYRTIGQNYRTIGQNYS